MLLMRKFTVLVIPVNYAAWGVPTRKAYCRCLTITNRGTGSHANIREDFFGIGV
jgi:hypothetical protein